MSNSPDAPNQKNPIEKQVDLYMAYRICNPEHRIDRWTFLKLMESKSADERTAFVQNTIEQYETIQQEQERKVRETIDELRNDPAELQRVGAEFLQIREDIERASH